MSRAEGDAKREGGPLKVALWGLGLGALAATVGLASRFSLRVMSASEAGTLSDLSILAVRPIATLIAALGLLVGAALALRGRTLGVLLSAAASASFATAYLVGIAPAFFLAIAIPGFLAAFVSAPRLFRRDAAAASVLLAGAIAVGAASALAIGPGLAWLASG